MIPFNGKIEEAGGFRDEDGLFADFCCIGGLNTNGGQ
jgi:hypothetical protein